MSTTTVVEQTENLVDAIARQHAEERREAYGRYRDLLLGNGSPAKGDAEQLRSLIDQLRLEPSDMRRDLAVLREAEGHQATTGESDAAQQRYDQADKQARKHKAETKKIVKQRGERQALLDDQRMTALCEMKDVTLAGKLRDRLVAENRELFGVEPAEVDDVAFVV